MTHPTYRPGSWPGSDALNRPDDRGSHPKRAPRSRAPQPAPAAPDTPHPFDEDRDPWLTRLPGRFNARS